VREVETEDSDGGVFGGLLKYESEAAAAAPEIVEAAISERLCVSKL
jgi:hypothetical protein